jgi:RHS repeat-associated protein
MSNLQPEIDLTDTFAVTGVCFEDGAVSYYRARYYDPNTGRFLSEDPLGLVGGLNLYRYVTNRPVSFVDPFGLVDILPIATYTKRTGMDALWHSGETNQRLSVQASCTCDKGGKFKLSITIVAFFPVYYSSDSVREHEDRHIAVTLNFLRSNLKKYEKFERQFDSLIECEYYKQKYATGFPNAGNPPELVQQLAQDFESRTYKDAQNNVDGWLGWLFHY